MNRRLYRSPDDRIIAGVAGGMSETWDLDPSIVRVGWALLALLTGGIFLVLYIIMAIVVPLRPAGMPAPGQVDPVGGGAAPGPDSVPTVAPYGGYPHRHRRDGSGAIIVGLLLVVLGIWFLARDYLHVDVGQLWPVFVVGLGLVLIVMAVARPSRRP